MWMFSTKFKYVMVADDFIFKVARASRLWEAVVCEQLLAFRMTLSGFWVYLFISLWCTVLHGAEGLQCWEPCAGQVRGHWASRAGVDKGLQLPHHCSPALSLSGVEGEGFGRLRLWPGLGQTVMWSQWHRPKWAKGVATQPQRACCMGVGHSRPSDL